MSIKRLAALALLSAIALAIFIAEAQLPPLVPIPGVKLGLANIVTLFVITVFGRKEAALVLAVRLFLGGVFSGSLSALIFSVSGAALAYAVMAALTGKLGIKLIWVVSALAAIAHNAGQLAAAVLVSGTSAILIWAPALLASGIVTGIFTGLCASYLFKALRGAGESL